MLLVYLGGQMRNLHGGEDAMLHLDQLEALYYELQLQLYDIQAEVLRCEELLLTAQLQSLRRQITGQTAAISALVEKGAPKPFFLVGFPGREAGRGGVLRCL